jgi:ligand-binding sensor domain-containing protein
MVNPGVLLLVLALLLAPPAVAQGREWQPEERAVIGDFTRIVAVATSIDRVFAVSPAALLVYLPVERRWEGPFLPRDAEALREVRSALHDPLDGGLWLVTRTGWLRFDPAIRLWESGSVPGLVSDAALDRDNPGGGLLLRTGGGWYSAGRGGIAIPARAPRQPVRAATVDEAIRSDPAIQATSASLTFTSRARDSRFLSAARAQGFTGQGWYLGSSGAGLIFYAEGAGRPEPLPFGLPGDRVGAVFAGLDGVWVATDRTATVDPALAFVGQRLAEVHWYQGPRATGLPFAAARRMLGMGSALWLATDNGVVRYVPEEDEATRFVGGGLPDSRVYDIAQRQGVLVAATAHGIARYNDSLGFVRLAPSFVDQALAVALAGDTVWVGTTLGLFAALPGEDDLRQPAQLLEALSTRVPVVALTWRGDTLVALTEDHLLWRDPGTGSFTQGPRLGAALGRLHTVINGRRGLYLAGERGVGFAGLATPVVRPFTTPGELPGPVTDIAVDDSFLWVATLRGLVRLSLELLR